MLLFCAWLGYVRTYVEISVSFDPVLSQGTLQCCQQGPNPHWVGRWSLQRRTRTIAATVCTRRFHPHDTRHTLYLTRTIKGSLCDVEYKGRLSRGYSKCWYFEKVGHHLPKSAALTCMGFREGSNSADGLLRRGLGRMPAFHSTKILSILYSTFPW